MQKTNSYPAIFDYADDGISISFPDLPGCFSCGWSEEEALRMVQEALGGYLECLLENGEKIPAPTPICEIAASKTQRVVLIAPSFY